MITLITNTAYHMFWLAISIIWTLDLNQEQTNGDQNIFSIKLWNILLCTGSLNILVNIVMVTLCFPVRSISVYHLVQALYGKRDVFEDLTDVSSEITPEILRRFVELEMAKGAELVENTACNKGEDLTRWIKGLGVYQKSRSSGTYVDPRDQQIQRSWPSSDTSSLVEERESTASLRMLEVDR